MTCSERTYGTFIRSFTLPETADPEKVGAACKNGVLTICIPKSEEVKPKSIKVEVRQTKSQPNLPPAAPDSTRRRAGLRVRPRNKQPVLTFQGPDATIPLQF